MELRREGTSLSIACGTTNKPDLELPAAETGPLYHAFWAGLATQLGLARGEGISGTPNILGRACG
jgi:hypothetical protein